jgi:transposase
MKLHANARLSVKGRELLVDRILMQGWSLAQAAEAAGVSDRTAAKWVRRYRQEGPAGLADRSSEPVRQPTRTPEDRVAAIAALRRVRLTGVQIAMALSMPRSTVSGILTSIGLGKLSRLEPVGCIYSIGHLFQAARYSWMRPPSRSCLRIATGGVVLVGGGCRGSGGASSSSQNPRADGRDRVLAPHRVVGSYGASAVSNWLRGTPRSAAERARG